MAEVEYRSNSYVPGMLLRSSPRLLRATRNTYGKTHGKRAALRTGLEDTEENTRHDNSPSAATSAGGSTASDVPAASNGPLPKKLLKRTYGTNAESLF
jgi:hypothetical protein